MNDSITFCKLFFFKSLFLRLQILLVPLKKGEFYKTRIAYLARFDSLYLLFKLIIWILYYLRKRTNCTISLEERHFPTSLCHIEKQQFYWNWSTLLFQISSLQSPNFNINKPTQRLASVGQLLLTNGLFPKTWLLPDHFQQNDVGYKTTDSQVLTLKKVYAFPKIECLLVRHLSIWEIYLRWLVSRSYIQSPSPLVLHIFVQKCYRCSD